MARRVQTTLRRGSRHNNAWFGVTSSTAITLAAGTSVLAGSLALSNAQIDETQLRVIGSITVTSDTASVEDQIGSAGLIVVSDAAIAVGITAIPKPSTDIEDDGWFCHTQFGQTSSAASSSAGVNSLMYPFNSKAKRIVHDGQSIAIVVQNLHATFGLKFILQFRILSRVTGT